MCHFGKLVYHNKIESLPLTRDRFVMKFIEIDPQGQLSIYKD